MDYPEKENAVHTGHAATIFRGLAINVTPFSNLEAKKRSILIIPPSFKKGLEFLFGAPGGIE